MFAQDVYTGGEGVRCKKGGEKRSDKKKKARVRGFVLFVNGADAGVVLFI